jgi:uncharacterized protein (TIGR02246 family)
MWDDARLGLMNIGRFSGVAVVSDVDWVRRAARLFAPLMPMPVRVFNDADIDEARRWISGEEAGTATSSDERAIRAVVARWMEATRQGDGDAVMELMCDDALFTVPGREPFGKDAFADGLAQMRDMRFEGTADVMEIEVVGDRAWTRARIDISLEGPDGKKVEKRAYTLTIFKRGTDGRWRLYRDANLPM